MDVYNAIPFGKKEQLANTTEKKPILGRLKAPQRELAANQHDQFIAVIEAGDSDAAADLAVAHWELSRAQIESFVTPDSINIPLGRAPGVA